MDWSNEDVNELGMNLKEEEKCEIKTNYSGSDYVDEIKSVTTFKGWLNVNVLLKG